MTSSTYVYKRNPQTGKLVNTGKREVYGYVPREGGGYNRGVAAVVDDKTGYVVPTEGALVGKDLSSSKPVVKETSQSSSASSNSDAQTTPQSIQEQKAVTPTPEHAVYLEQTSASAIIRRAVQAEQPSQETRVQPSPKETFTQRLERNIYSLRKQATQNENKNGVAAAGYATGAFLLGGVRGTVNLGRTIVNVFSVNPEKNTINQLTKNIPEKVSSLSTIGSTLKNPDTAGEIVIPSLLLGVAGKVASKLTSARAEVIGEAKAKTVSFDLKNRVTGEASEATAALQVNRKLGGVPLKPREFKVDVATKAKTRPDLEGTSIRNERSVARVQEVDPGELLNPKAKVKKTYDSVSRSDVQIRDTKSSGTFTMTTETRGGALQQSGRVASKTKEVSSDSFITGTAIETSSPKKVTVVPDVNNLRYPKKIGSPKKLTAVASKTNKLVEVEAPLNVNIFDEGGVKASAQTAPVRQTLSETGSVSISGKSVQKGFQSGSDVSVSRTPEGKLVVDVNVNRVQSSSSGRSLSTQVLKGQETVQSVNVGSQNVQFGMGKNAVETIVESELKGSVSRTVSYTGSVVVASNIKGGSPLTPVQVNKEQRVSSPSILEPVVVKEQVVSPVVTPKKEQKPVVSQKPFSGIKPREKKGAEYIIKPTEEFKPKQDVSQNQVQQQEQVQETVVSLKQVNSQGLFRESAFAKTPFTIIPVVPGKKSSVDVQGFGVLVRRKGVFRPVGGVFNEKDALSFGRNVAGTTLAASFRIQPVNEKPNEKYSSGDIRGQDFYKSKRETGVFIQKSSARLSNPGEKAEIKKSKRFKL